MSSIDQATTDFLAQKRIAVVGVSREHGGKHSLFYAAEKGMAELVEELIEEGADAALTNAVRARAHK